MNENRLLEERGHALENAFFARQDEALLKRLREADSAATRRQALSAASGVTDAAVLDHWDTLGLRPQSLAALSLVPLVLVAWADGSLDDKEATAVREAARSAGLRSGEAGALLDAWLTRPPGREIEAAWRDYAHALAARMPPEARAALERETVGRARQVAEAAGGFLGLGSRVSEAEERVLASLAAPFR